MLHIKRANYQAMIWKKAMDGQFYPPNPDGNGWKVSNDDVSIVWITKDPAPKAILEFISCKSCKKCNTRRCPCQNRNYKCTDACGCNVEVCENSDESGRCHFEDSDDDD